MCFVVLSNLFLLPLCGGIRGEGSLETHIFRYCDLWVTVIASYVAHERGDVAAVWHRLLNTDDAAIIAPIRICVVGLVARAVVRAMACRALERIGVW